MSNSEVLMFPVEDPNFRVSDGEQYNVLMNWLTRTTLELAQEHPENPVLVVYIPEKGDDR